MDRRDFIRHLLGAAAGLTEQPSLNDRRNAACKRQRDNATV